MSTAGSMPEWRIPDGMELKRRRSYANRSSRRSASPRNHTRSTRIPCARSRISRWRGSAPPGVDEPGRRNTSVHSPGDFPGGSAAVLLRCADSGAVRRFYFAAGAGLGHSCRREALRRRAPADSYCPGNTQVRPGGKSGRSHGVHRPGERSAVTVLYRKAEGFTSTARISRYRRITKPDKDSAV